VQHLKAGIVVRFRLSSFPVIDCAMHESTHLQIASANYINIALQISQRRYTGAVG